MYESIYRPHIVSANACRCRIARYTQFPLVALKLWLNSYNSPGSREPSLALCIQTTSVAYSVNLSVFVVTLSLHSTPQSLERLARTEHKGLHRQLSRLPDGTPTILIYA